MDAQKFLVDATAHDFIFDNPAEAASVPRAELPAYMQCWFARAGGVNEWMISHALRKDRGGVLTDLFWYQAVGTSLYGFGLVTTRDDGVSTERIIYFRRDSGKHAG